MPTTGEFDVLSSQRSSPNIAPAAMNTSHTIPDYMKELRYINHSNSSSWLNQCEVPSSTEINDTDEKNDIPVPVNKVAGEWKDKEEYLKSHYLLLREDAVTPLRNAVSELRNLPHIMEAESEQSAGIYEKVHLIGLTFATSGIAARIAFSLRRVGKRILWEQSKRLLPGSIVALTPAKDMFGSVCLVATVASRPLASVQMNPPELDIFFARVEELEMDPQEEWIMVESREGYFEAYRHTLRSLQKMSTERFPLWEHLVSVNPTVAPPPYLKDQPFKDMSLLYPAEKDEYQNVDVINKWPQANPTTLDTSQFQALRRILTKQLAIVQGPPGTGKTHVSVIALELLLRNMGPGDPPVIIAAHTNHAVDQLLRHVARFEPNFIRLGGMTTDQEKIKPRTLYEVRNQAKQGPGFKSPSLAKMNNVKLELKQHLAPLLDGEEPFSAELFKLYGIITETQLASLEKGAAEWVRVDASDQVPGDIAMWLGRELVKADARTAPEDFGFEVEEVDLGFEQLKELEAESKTEDDVDTLRGERMALKEPFTGRKSSRGVTDDMVKAALEKQDMWQIEESLRGGVYRLMQQQLKDAMRRILRSLAKAYEETVQELKIGRWMNDAKLLRKTPVIGMTTTGLSKYRALIQSLKPKVVLIEEAAETLEAYVTAACFQSLQHLILVGDHQQLRGHCTVRDLEGHPWFLDVSMFERLVRNRVEFSRMSTQRRMIPEIRRALKPIYEDLTDHESVLNKPSIPGMGKVNTFFFSHDWPESSDSQTSKVNYEEANMIIAFFYYLVQNGTEVGKITILTFYNGQRKLLLKGLRSHPSLQGFRFNVATVDSYQGEENDIVILSLARSNLDNRIGFLAVENRVCVALSRAQRGFYIFGNAMMLCQANPLWWAVIQIMGENPTRVGFTLPITCENHGEELYFKEPHQFSALSGGCEKPCKVKLPCGHVCPLKCHSYPHELVDCRAICKKMLECGHECVEFCHVPCRCTCNRKERGHLSRSSSPSPRRPLPITVEGRAFREYSEGGHIESDAKIDAIVTSKLTELQLEQADKDATEPVPVENEGHGMRLVRTSSDADGTKRGVWKGIWGKGKEKQIENDPESMKDGTERNGDGSSSKGEGEEEGFMLVDSKPEDSKTEDWTVQPSLLD